MLKPNYKACLLDYDGIKLKKIDASNEIYSKQYWKQFYTQKKSWIIPIDAQLHKIPQTFDCNWTRLLPIKQIFPFFLVDQLINYLLDQTFDDNAAFLTEELLSRQLIGIQCQRHIGDIPVACVRCPRLPEETGFLLLSSRTPLILFATEDGVSRRHLINYNFSPFVTPERNKYVGFLIVDDGVFIANGTVWSGNFYLLE